MSSYQGFTAAQKKNIPLLDKYRCKVCHKWKEPASFSNNELQKFTSKAIMGKVLNGVTAELRCRGCTGGAVTEKQCEGPCKRWLDLQKFSKASRSAGGNQYCTECTIWKESQEPGIVTEAPPEAEDDSDGWEGGVYSDPEAGDSGSDYEDYARTTTSVMGSNTNVPAPAVGSRKPASAVTSSIAPREHMQVPYHGLAAISLTGSTNSETGRTMDTAKLSVPTMSGPGSRNAQAQFDLKSDTSSVSNPYENPSTTQGQAWGAMDARRRAPAPVKFTAWDNQGQAHTQQKVQSGSGSVYTPIPSGTTATAAARPFGSRQLPQTTTSGPSRPAPPQTQTRPVGSRQPPQTTTSGPSRPAPPQTQTRTVEDSDSDDDLYAM